MSSGPGYARDPSHKLVLEPAEGRWRARRNGSTLADSESALRIREDGYPPVIYFPPEAVNFELLQSSDRRSYCPFKGEASYRSVDDVTVAWCYAAPYDEVAAIAGHLAFYADRVTVERIDG